MKVLHLLILLCISGALALGAGRAVADDGATSPSVTLDAVAPAIAFLQKVEQKNKETSGLKAEFRQVKVDLGLMDTVESRGTFWYQSPDRFRADYETDNSSTIWMFDGQLITYVPGIEQVDIVDLPKGDDAPIHQLLLGFGVKVDEIQKLFDVELIEEDTTDELVRIRFESKDLSRSMEYQTIKITFSRESAEPKKIVLEDEQTEFTLDLTEVELNPKIAPEIFETSWPEEANVLHHRGH